MHYQDQQKMNNETYQEIIEKLQEGREYKNYVLKDGQVYKGKMELEKY